MNSIEYYNRQKEAWESKELDDLKREYLTNELSISEIADIHRRTPGAIAYKLKTLGVIIANALARGYSEYTNSKLYKDIVESGKVLKSERIVKKQGKLRADIESVAIVTTSKEILDLKNEVASLKKDVKEMLRLMNMLYDFESQSTP